jgi:hypothetical protein
MAKPSASENDILWISDNPTYGVVRRVLFYGDFAAQFDDLNSDFREVELSIFERGAQGWEKEYSQDDADYPVHKDDAWVYGFLGGFRVFAYGRARPHARARVELYGGTWAVDVDADGWWFLVAGAPEQTFEAAMAAEDGRWRSIQAEIGSGASDGVLPGDAPDGHLDAFRSPLRVTVD